MIGCIQVGEKRLVASEVEKEKENFEKRKRKVKK